MGFTQDNGLFIDESSISSIAASTTAVEGTDFTGFNVALGSSDKVAVQVEATGDDASASGTVTFRFVSSPDGSNFDTESLHSVTVSLDGTNTVRSTSVVDIEGVSDLRLEEIENGDGTYSLSNPTARYGYLL